MSTQQHTLLTWQTQSSIQHVAFDAVVSQTHLTSATPTEHNVEQGVAITDHVRPGAAKLTLECIISNAPIDMPSSADDDFTEGVIRQSQSVTVPGGQASTYQFSAQFDRVRKVYDALTGVQENAIPVSVITSLENYDNMIICAISAPRSSEMGTSAIRFTMDLQQIKIVQTSTVPPAAPAKQPQKRGSRASKQEADTKRATVLHSLIGSLVH